MDSILNTVKVALGVEAEYNGFDTQILLDINSAVSGLNQIGIGPAGGFVIKGESETWDDLLGQYVTVLEQAKSYVFFKVRLSFDPPSSSYLVDSIGRQISELEWRLAVLVETPVQIDESVSVNKKAGIMDTGHLLLAAIDYGTNGLDGSHGSDVVLGGPVNRAYYDGIDSYTNFYSSRFAELFDADEFVLIIRGKARYPSIYTDGLGHSLLVIYSAPFGDSLTISIPSSGNAIKLQRDFNGPPFSLSRTVVTTSLDWQTYGVRASHLAGTLFFDVDGVQQGLSLGDPLWSLPIGEFYCRIGNLRWLGWGADLIVSLNGRTATSQQMLTIHTKLNTGTLTIFDLNTIFGVGNYIWLPMNEG